GRERPPERVVLTVGDEGDGPRGTRRRAGAVELGEPGVVGRTDPSVGGAGGGEALRALDALRLPLDGAAVGDGAVLALLLPADRQVGVAVAAGPAGGERESSGRGQSHRGRVQLGPCAHAAAPGERGGVSEPCRWCE